MLRIVKKNLGLIYICHLVILCPVIIGLDQRSLMLTNEGVIQLNSPQHFHSLRFQLKHCLSEELTSHWESLGFTCVEFLVGYYCL